MIIGSVWYSKVLFGNAWMNINGFKEEGLKEGNMGVILGVSYLFSVLLAVIKTSMVIHQVGAFQMMMSADGAMSVEAQQQFDALMTQYGKNFRTFGHGAMHGVMATLFVALPIIGINALFERRGWKYIGIYTGYWVLTFALMGGLLCATLKYT